MSLEGFRVDMGWAAIAFSGLDGTRVLALFSRKRLVRWSQRRSLISGYCLILNAVHGVTH